MFDHVLKLVIDQALNNTTTTLLLTDTASPRRPTSRSPSTTSAPAQHRYNFVHTMNREASRTR